MAPEVGHSLASFAPLVDPRVGLIRSVDIVKLSENDPRVFLAYAEPADTTPLFNIRAANKGAACAATADKAILRACGESLERYCSSCYDETAIIMASEAELRDRQLRFIRTAELYPYADEQYEGEGFPFDRVGPNDRLGWCEAIGFDGAKVFVPASCTYVPYRFRSEFEPFTHMPISTGLAAGRSIEFCIDKGINEILERDALMINWAHRRSPPRLDPLEIATLSPSLDRLIRAIPGRSQLKLVWLTLDVPVPIVGAALVDPNEPPLTSFGISADMNAVSAIESAIEEAMLTRLLVNRMSPGEVPRDQIRTLHDHLKAHAFGAWSREAMRFLLEDGPLVSLAEIDRPTSPDSSAFDLVRKLGFDGAWIDITSPDVAEFGFKVVRTVMPGFQPLDSDHRYRYLGGKRLAEAVERLGGSRIGPSGYNPDPHPFP